LFINIGSFEGRSATYLYLGETRGHTQKVVVVVVVGETVFI